MAELENNEINNIEVIEPKVVKPRKVKTVVKYTFLDNVGSRDGAIRYVKGQSYELTKKQIDNYKKNKLICQH